MPMHQWIQMSADLETGIEEITQAGEVIEQAGVSASTISILLERLGELARRCRADFAPAVYCGSNRLVHYKTHQPMGSIPFEQV